MSFDSGEKKQRVRSDVKPEDLDGSLVLMYPSGYLKADEETGRGAKTMFGLKDIGFAHIVQINDDGTGVVHEGASFLQGFLVGSIRRQYYKWQNKPVADRMPVLARFGKGEKKTGQSAPWVFGSFSEKDVKTAEKYLKSNPVPDHFLDPDYYDETPTQTPAPAEVSTEAPF
jgi:hypothetical protein